MAERYVFIERDGGLLAPADRGNRGSVESLSLRRDCLAALARFRDSGYRLVLLIEPGPASRPGDDAAESRKQAILTELLASQSVPLEAVEVCTHEREAGCDCALPGIGLVAGYVADATLDRSRSIVVGGNDEALALARAMGLKGFVVDDAHGWPDIAHAVLDRPRRASVERKTRETDIRVSVDLDRAEDPRISTGIGFFDHMLEQLGKHGGFELEVDCAGDLEVDEHHTIEDVALALGQALKAALGDKRGIARYGFLLPMDEAEAQIAIDLSGRPYAVFEGEFPRESVGGLPTELVRHFFRSLAESLGAAVHVSVRGENAHHMVEACFKGVARALRQAFSREGSDLPSTKGSL
ncbi:MAG TPA: imidazoleglycerol-phosphate dehydratase HisB [Gammaproteobacteria bacterium]|nr:imidazoleglycerol-phosphate dehydratase HisB [Gammaproteobacteria bacterium]